MIWVSNYFGLNAEITIIFWAAGLIVGGIIASFMIINWNILFFYILIISFGVGLLQITNLWTSTSIFLVIYGLVIAFFGLLIVDIYRRSHLYYITNFRLVLSGGLLRRMERSLRYDKITDISGEQGVIGRVFGFGTVIPITHSGFGIGVDSTFSGGGTQADGKKVSFFGFAGGKKEIQVPKLRSYFELHGVYPYGEVKQLIESLVQESTCI